jgi:hypothetical protein
VELLTVQARLVRREVGDLPLTAYSLDKFVAPHLSELTCVGAPDVSDCSEHYSRWVNALILNSIFRVKIEDRYRMLSMQFLRKTDGTLQEYHEARDYLARYLADSGQAVSAYFHALRHFEASLILAYQAYEALRYMVQERLFEQDDDSPLQRLNRLQNITKHACQELERGDLPKDLSLPIWLTDSAVECHDSSLSWSEFADLLTELARVADVVANPTIPEQDAIPA